MCAAHIESKWIDWLRGSDSLSQIPNLAIKSVSDQIPISDRPHLFYFQPVNLFVLCLVCDIKSQPKDGQIATSWTRHIATYCSGVRHTSIKVVVYWDKDRSPIKDLNGAVTAATLKWAKCSWTTLNQSWFSVYWTHPIPSTITQCQWTHSLPCRKEAKLLRWMSTRLGWLCSIIPASFQGWQSCGRLSAPIWNQLGAKVVPAAFSHRYRKPPYSASLHDVWVLLRPDDNTHNAPWHRKRGGKRCDRR